MVGTEKAMRQEINAQAAAWLARLQSDARTPGDEAAFRAWLASDPLHQAAFDRATLVFDIAGGLADYKPPKPVTAPRRAVLAGLGTALVGGASLTVWRQAQASVHETAVGEERHVALADGVDLTLDTDTKVRVGMLDAHRLELCRGRVAVTTTAEGQALLTITAADQRLTSNDMAADVRLDAGKVTIVLIKGQATVQRRGGDDLKLSAGDRLSEGRIDRPDLEPLLAWREGQAVFVDQTLAQACQELNRYSQIQLRPAPSVAALRVSGVYQAGDSLRFARSLPQFLPVAVSARDGEILLTPATGSTGG
jgi:transmembrane sensor